MLLIVCAGVVLASLDLFIVNLALPRIARDFGGSDLGELSWVLNGYAIVYASLLVFFGRLADRYRRDRAFLLGVAVFTAASAACAASTSVGMLIAFRLVQAAGGALLTPTSLASILASHEPARRHAAVRAWTAVGGLAAALGPVIGGLLVAIDWRLVFLVNVPVGVVALVVGARRLPVVPGQAVQRPDPQGVVLVTAGVAALTLGLVEGGSWGWESGRVLVALVGGVALLGLFARHCRRSANPLVPPALFRFRPYTGAALVNVFYSAAFGAMILSIVLWEQGPWRWSALHSGLAMAPGPIMVPTMAFLVTGRLIARFGTALVTIAGSALLAAGTLWWVLGATARPDYLAGVLGGMILTGMGVGLTLPTIMAAGSASLPPPAFATGSAVINMIRQAGLALGVAALVAVLGSAPAVGAFRRGWLLVAALSLAGVVPAAFLLRRAALAPVSRAPDGVAPTPAAAPGPV